jgi:hypothetical protein
MGIGLFPMAREPRIEFAGPVYRVMSRGDQGEGIFYDNDDRHQLLDWSGKTGD